MNYDEGFIIAEYDEEYPVGINDAPEYEEDDLWDDYTETDAAMQDLVDDTEEEQ